MTFVAGWMFFLFFFQAEDGIRDDLVTGVQTCALPISKRLANDEVSRAGHERIETVAACEALIRAPYETAARLREYQSMALDADRGVTSEFKTRVVQNVASTLDDDQAAATKATEVLLGREARHPGW